MTSNVNLTSSLPINRVAELSDPRQISELVREASAHNSPLYIAGSGSRLTWGGRPTKPGCLLSLQSSAEIVDYQPGELTVIANAATPVGQINTLLGQQRQWIPALSFLPEELTLGGVLSCPLPSVHDWRWGRIADSVLGLRVVDGRGELLELGGKVVKNAAGYRLARLFLGSWGTLGIITQAVLMTRPVPESSRLIELVMHRASWCETLLDVLSAYPLPCLSEVQISRCIPSDDPAIRNCRTHAGQVAVTFLLEGDAFAVEDAERQICTLAEKHRWTIRGCSEACRDAEPMRRIFRSDGGLYHIAGVPDSLPALAARVDEFLPGANWWGLLFSGQIVVHDQSSAGDAKTIVALRQAIEASGGELTVLQMPKPATWAREILWPPNSTSTRYSYRWKDVCDPSHILNPGRFIFP